MYQNYKGISGTTSDKKKKGVLEIHHNRSYMFRNTSDRDRKRIMEMHQNDKVIFGTTPDNTKRGSGNTSEQKEDPGIHQMNQKNKWNLADKNLF